MGTYKRRESYSSGVLCVSLMAGVGVGCGGAPSENQWGGPPPQRPKMEGLLKKRTEQKGADPS